MNAEILAWLAVALLGVFLSALYSGLETGAYCVNRLRLAARAGGERPDRLAAILRREIERPRRLLSALLIGNNAGNYLGTLGVAALLRAAGFGDAAAIAINAVVITPVLFVFGETLPKDLFRAEADRLTRLFSPALLVSRWVMTATLLLPAVRGAGVLAERLVGGRPSERLGAARARIAALVKEGARHGALPENQLALVDRALAMRDLALRGEATPWRKTAVVGADWTRVRVESALRASLHTRYPVVDRRGRVVGVIEGVDVWLDPEKRVSQLMRAPLLLPATASVRDAINTLQERGERIAIVGSRDRPVGVVTLKDLVEPLVGELAAW